MEIRVKVCLPIRIYIRSLEFEFQMVHTFNLGAAVLHGKNTPSPTCKTYSCDIMLFLVCS